MANHAVEREVLELENRYWQALKDQDADTAMRLSDDPCIITGGQGVHSLPRSAYPEMMKSAGYTLDSFKLEKPQVRMLGEDVAIVAYNVHEELTLDGKSITLDAADSSTWVKRNGRWMCALHTEAAAGDPFGRDRKKQTAA